MPRQNPSNIKANRVTTPFIKTKAPFAFFCSYAARPALFILLANKRVLIIAINPPKTEEIASEEPTAKKLIATATMTMLW